MPAIIIRASQLSMSNIELSIAKFEEKTNFTAKEIRNIISKQGKTIDSYKTGIMDDNAFFNKMNKKFGEKNQLNKIDFFECWNAMCKIPAEQLEQLKQIQELCQQRMFEGKEGLRIYVTCASNSMHIDYIGRQLLAARIDLDIDFICSYDPDIQSIEQKRLNEVVNERYDQLVKDFSPKTLEDEIRDLSTLKDNLSIELLQKHIFWATPPTVTPGFNFLKESSTTIDDDVTTEEAQVLSISSSSPIPSPSRLGLI